MLHVSITKHTLVINLTFSVCPLPLDKSAIFEPLPEKGK
jgi:hypothetical protein